ncbi:rhodanese-like domain-containing protein [Rubritalea tangerina]|uniref:Rhodanese-like domain-containing protein n=1 Tax=Rubritalea tangerina TaxID=430798 RepID=A0ABW4Z8E6_9BACT
MKWILQSVVFVVISAIFAVGTFLVLGGPDRTVPCVQAEMKDVHVCLETVLVDWQGDVLWVDARSRAEFERERLAGALLIPENDADNQLAVPIHMEKIGMAGVNGQKLVVYCATDACGSSEFVAKKIRDTGFHSEVYILHGGWKAIRADADRLTTEQGK